MIYFLKRLFFANTLLQWCSIDRLINLKKSICSGNNSCSKFDASFGVLLIQCYPGSRSVVVNNFRNKKGANLNWIHVNFVWNLWTCKDEQIIKHEKQRNSCCRWSLSMQQRNLLSAYQRVLAKSTEEKWENKRFKKKRR